MRERQSLNLKNSRKEEKADSIEEAVEAKIDRKSKDYKGLLHSSNQIQKWEDQLGKEMDSETITVMNYSLNFTKPKHELLLCNKNYSKNHGHSLVNWQC